MSFTDAMNQWGMQRWDYWLNNSLQIVCYLLVCFNISRQWSSLEMLCHLSSGHTQKITIEMASFCIIQLKMWGPQTLREQLKLYVFDVSQVHTCMDDGKWCLIINTRWSWLNNDTATITTPKSQSCQINVRLCFSKGFFFTRICLI